MTTTKPFIRWRSIDKGVAYRSVAGHYLFKLGRSDPSRVPGLGWRLLDPQGDWMDDYASADKAKAGAREAQR